MLKLFLVYILFQAGCLMAADFKNPLKSKLNFFEVILDRTEVLFEITSIIEWHIRVAKVNKTRSLVGYLTLHETFGNNVMVEGKTLKKQGGEYRYLPYTIQPTQFCDTLANDKYAYQDIAKNSDFPEDITSNCSFPPGNYSFYGATANLENAPSAIAPTGEYAGEMSYYKDDQHIATYRIYGYVNNV